MGKLWAIEDHTICDPRFIALNSSFAAHSSLPLSDVLYNLSTGVKRLFGQVHRGELGVLLARAEREQPSAPAPQRRLTMPQITQLILEYKAGLGSVYLLARNYGVDRSTVSGYLRNAGLQLGRLPLSDGEVERAARLRADGNSYNAIGRTMRRDPKTIKKALTYIRISKHWL